jgi:hypothetical protein
MRWSAGPFLELSSDDVGPTRNRAVLGYIESHMLFPDDEEKRHRCIAATAATAVDEFIDALPKGSFVNKDVAQALRRAPELPQFDDELKRRFCVGAVVGNVLVRMITEPTATPKVLFEQTENEFNKTRKILRISTLPIQAIQKNWWPRFKSVSHLWAASVAQKSWTEHAPFPCALANLPEFLASAEYIRHLAERRPLAMQGDVNLLRFGEVLAVEPRVSLPFPPIVIEGHRAPWHRLNGTIGK